MPKCGSCPWVVCRLLGDTHVDKNLPYSVTRTEYNYTETQTQLGLSGIYLESWRTRRLYRWVGVVRLVAGVIWRNLPGRGSRCHVWRAIGIRRHTAQEWVERARRTLTTRWELKTMGGPWLHLEGVNCRKQVAQGQFLSPHIAVAGLVDWLNHVGWRRAHPSTFLTGGIRLKWTAGEPWVPKEDLAVYILSGEDWEGEAKSLFWRVG